MNQRDLTLLTDFYELTMMQGYYEKGQNEIVIFDVFYRQNPCNGGYAICAGQGPDAGLYGARAAVIGGCVGTSNVLAGKLFDVPVLGTHAHSWIMSFPDEYTAFKAYADLYPDNCTLLVDTYDTLKSGVPNAIRVFQEMRDAGVKLTRYGIRLDSGDLAYLSNLQGLSFIRRRI